MQLPKRNRFLQSRHHLKDNNKSVSLDFPLGNLYKMNFLSYYTWTKCMKMHPSKNEWKSYMSESMLVSTIRVTSWSLIRLRSIQELHRSNHVFKSKKMHCINFFLLMKKRYPRPCLRLTFHKRYQSQQKISRLIFSFYRFDFSVLLKLTP